MKPLSYYGLHLVKHITEDEKLPPLTSKDVLIYRYLHVNSIHDINFSDLGNHWTSSFNYYHGDKYVNPFVEKYKIGENVFRIAAIFNKNRINENATIESREDYPYEKETVIKRNSHPLAIAVTKKENGFFYKQDRWVSIQNNNISTGDNIDDWVKTDVRWQKKLNEKADDR